MNQMVYRDENVTKTIDIRNGRYYNLNDGYSLYYEVASNSLRITNKPLNGEYVLVAHADRGYITDGAMVGWLSMTKGVDLSNYYTKTEVDRKIAEIPIWKREVVSQLPAVYDADKNTLYLVPRSDSETNNIYDEWLYVENNGIGGFERIGSTDVDLTDYQKVHYVNVSSNGYIIDGSQVIYPTLTKSEMLSAISKFEDGYILMRAKSGTGEITRIT